MTHRWSALWLVCFPVAGLPYLLGAGCGGSESPHHPKGCFELADGQCVEETFQNPPVLAPDDDGVLRLTLGPSEVTIAGQRHCVRSYNGMYPGPTIDTQARAGAPRSVRIDLVNSFANHDFRDLKGDTTCACTTAAGDACVPAHIHDKCSAPAPDPCVCHDADGEECVHMFDFNTTNLHAHGGHLRPGASTGADCTPRDDDGKSVKCRDCDSDLCDGDATDDRCYYGDDVLSVVHPGTGAQFRWDIDEDRTHHEGLNWYHPHIHGTTTIQVIAGAVGAWIVRGDLDEIEGVREARERVIVFQTPSIANGNGFQPLADGVACTEDTITFNDFSVTGDVAATTLNVINGVRRPRLIVAPGQVERWRIVDAGFLDEVYLGLFRGDDSDCSSFSTKPEDTLQLVQYARDGTIMPETFAGDYIFLSPGYRIEAMVGGSAFKDGDTYCLVAGRFGQGDNIGSTAPTLEDIRLRLHDGDVVAMLNVTEKAGKPTATAMPDFAAIAKLAPSTTLDGVSIEDRCAQAAAITSPEGLDEAAVLQVGFWTADEPDPCKCDNYNVNCRNIESVDRSRYPFDRDLPLGQVAHWRVAAAVDGHPFHIHINPFIVCPSENPFDPVPFAHYRDTYLVNLNRKIDLITQYESYTGAFVLHCHKLTHEDEGMMQILRICDPATDTTCGDYGWRKCQPDDLACLQALAATDCTIGAKSPADLVACSAKLALGVCGPNACLADGDCPDLPGPPAGPSCEENVCH